MKLNRTGTAAVLVIIIAIGLFFRLLSIRTYSPNPDEFHWVWRSEKVNELYSEGQITRLTNHLGHPGIPATVLMSLAERAADKWNAITNTPRGGRAYIDHLTAARLANVLWFVLLIPLIYTTMRRAIGSEAALLAAALVSFDTQHISNTRIAHIDGALTTLVFCCVTLYIEAQTRRSLYLKLLSGAAWGLCLSVKPTAISLIPGFILGNALWRYSATKAGNKNDAPPIVSWSDVLTAVVGMLTLAAFHTRFWDPYSKLVRVHHINPLICDWIVGISQVLGESVIIMPVIALLTVGWAIYCLKRYSDAAAHSKLSDHFCAIVFGIGLIVTLIGYFPTITANLVRYWYWVLGLSKMQHVAYGGTPITPPSGGYTRIWASRTTPWMALGFFAAAFWSLAGMWSKDRWSWLKKHREILSYVLMAFVWTSFLSASSKQAFRYTLPMVPLIAGFAAYGLVQTWSLFQKRFRIVSGAVVPLMLAVPQLASAIYVTPDFGLYFSSYTGGVRGAMDAGASIQPARYEQAFAAIDKVAANEHHTQIVEVAGDFDLLRASYNRTYLPGERKLTIVSYQDGLGSDWVINFPYFVAHKIGDFNRMHNLELQYEFDYDGGIIYQLYKVNPLPKDQSIRIDLSDTARATGSLYKDPETDISNLELDADVNHSGFGVFGLYLKIPAGKATFRLKAAIHEIRHELTEPVMKIGLSKKCMNTIYPADFGSPVQLEQFKTFEIQCEFDHPTRAQPTVYWFSKQSVMLKDLSVEIH